MSFFFFFFFFQAEDGIRDLYVTGVQTCALPISPTDPPPFPGGRAPTAAEVTAQQIEVGMPAGAAIFARTDPTCALSADATTFRCTLSRAPAPEISNFLDAKEPLAIGGRVAGGCLGLDRGGMSWDCYIGQEAVDRAIIGQNLLGQPAPYPGRG